MEMDVALACFNRSSVFAEGASFLIFEGGSDDSSSITFNEYYGDTHVEHTGCETHRAFLIDVAEETLWTENAKEKFTEKLLAQQNRFISHLASRHGDQQDHRIYRAIVRFGRHYIINLPRSMYKETILPSAVSQLETYVTHGIMTRLSKTHIVENLSVDECPNYPI